MSVLWDPASRFDLARTLVSLTYEDMVRFSEFVSRGARGGPKMVVEPEIFLRWAKAVLNAPAKEPKS